MRAVKSKTLGERIFGKKLKAGSASKTVLPPCNKRKLNLDDQPNKKSKIEVEKQKWKMDLNVKGQCVGVLDALLSHRHGFVFKCPVDPVSLNVPDYLTVISHPMDLGTIKSKLTANAYRTAQEFAADVKLTFSNAMLYNPPDNQVHSIAKELDGLFLKQWKVLEAKWTCSLNSVPSKTPMDEKKKLKKDLTEILVGTTADKFRSEFRKLGLEIPRKEVIDLEFDKFDEDALLLLKRVVKDSKPNVLNLAATTKSASGETDLKKAIITARAAMMKKRSADSAKEANANCDDISGKVQQRATRQIEERNARVNLETRSKGIFDEDKVLAYDQLLELCGCFLSYDSHIGVVLRLREIKTRKLVDPLARIGLQLKKEFIANSTDYDDYVDMDLEEGEILESECYRDIEDGEILE